MANLLHIDASPRSEKLPSHSRQIGAEFVQAWLTAHPGTTETRRDLTHEPLPYVDEDWVISATYLSFTPDQRTPEQREKLALSDALIAELQQADTVVITTPMYNFGVPAQLKTYVDTIVRIGVSIHYGPNGPEGQLKGKRLFIVTARGGAGYDPGEPREAYNFTDTYLKAVFAFLGITDTTVITVDSTLGGDDTTAASLSKARAAITQAVQS